MGFLKNINLSLKLPMIIIVLALGTALITAGLSYNSAKTGLTNEAHLKLEAILQDRATSLEDWLASIQNDMETQSANPSVIAALTEFTAAWAEVPGDKTTYLQDWYIQRNPNPTGSKEVLNFAYDGSTYSTVHSKYHPYLRTFLRDRGYYDVFLFDQQGNLVYSVFKELDYATNLVTGEWSQSDLGAAFKAARAAQSTGDIVFFDFQPYAPSHGAPASFIAKALKDSSGNFIGVLAFQMPIDRLNTIMARSAGLGETGETILIGQDNLMRNDSRFSEESTILKRKIESEAAADVLAGNTGNMIKKDHEGTVVASAYKPVEFLGVRWGILAQQAESELTAPATALLQQVLLQLLVSMIVISAIGLWVGQLVAKPMFRIRQAMQSISEREYETEVPHTDQKDEVGGIANTLTQFRDKLVSADENNQETVFKGSAFDGSSLAMMMIDRDFNVVYVNNSTKKLLQDHAEAFKQLWPSFDAANIVGTCIDIFHKNPAHQRQLLSDPARLPYQTDIAIGDLKISLAVSAVFDENGEYAGNTLEWNDVTQDRTNAGILNAIDRRQAVIEFTMDGNVISANQNFLDAMGYSLEEIIGKHHRMFVDRSYAASEDYEIFWRKLQSGEFHTGKFERFSKSGESVWIEASYNAVLDTAGKPYRVVKIATDITENELARQQAQSEIKRHTAEQEHVVSILADSLRGLSEGNLSSTIEEQFSSEYETLRKDFNQAVLQLQGAMKKIAINASSIRGNAEEISQAADDLSKRTENQAASLEETAAALDEVTATVQQTAQAANQANSVVKTTRSDAETSGEVVRQAVDAMSAIEKSSGQISQIIGVIDEIAFQTNLLALNAGVEAARAGEAGRGFAVVASEVRALAQRSSEAAKEIKDLISASEGHVSTGVDLVGQTGTALEKIVTSVAEVTSLVSDIAASAQEQATGLAEVNTAMNEMDQVTQQNAAMVEESTAASHSLTNESSELANLVRHFDLGDVEEMNDLMVAQENTHQPQDNVVAAQQQRVETSFAMSSGANALQAEPVDEDDWQDF
jgi:methyl-accepting chemotaxis protein